MHPVLIHLGNVLIPSYGAVAALGLLLALFLAQRTARIVGVDANQVWNLSVIGIFAALVASRLLVIGLNLSAIRAHPGWMLAVGMIHHPLLAGVGALAGGSAAGIYALRKKLPLRKTADVLAAPVLLGLAFEQVGALLAGSGYGSQIRGGVAARWAVTYSHPLAALWSGTPLGVALHPVQAYAALADLNLAVVILIWLPLRRRAGDAAGGALIGFGVLLFVTEFWRDMEGRGSLMGGAMDGPQVAAVLLVVMGALVVADWKKKSNFAATDAEENSEVSRGRIVAMKDQREIENHSEEAMHG